MRGGYRSKNHVIARLGRSGGVENHVIAGGGVVEVAGRESRIYAGLARDGGAPQGAIT